MSIKTFEERCRLSEQCLPDAPYRAMLTKLHEEMLEEIKLLKATRKDTSDAFQMEAAMQQQVNDFMRSN